MEKGSHVLRRLGVLPLLGFVALIAILVSLDLRAVFEPPLLLPLLTAVFLSIIPLVVAYFSARSYVSSGSRNLLLLGCGMLAFGSGSLLAGWLIAAPGGPNVAVTIHNGGALVSAGFHTAGAILTSAGILTDAGKRGCTLKVLLAFLGVLAFTALLTTASLLGALPPFFIQGVGPTAVRQAVLGTAMALFAFASLLFMIRYARTRSDFLYWYSLALALLAVGLSALFLQKAVGSPIGWAGRSAQYLGCIYFLIAVLTAARGARARGISLEKALAEFFRAAEAQYKALVETSSDAIISVHHEGRVLLWNSAAVKIFGYSRDEALGSSLVDLIIPEKYADRMREELAKLATTGKSSLIGRATEIEAKRRDGEVFPVELSVSARKTADGWIGTVILRDITERKRMEEEIMKLSQFRESIIDNANVWLDVLDANANVVIWNKAAEEISGYSRDEVVGHGKIWEWLYPDEAYRKEITTKAAAIIEKGAVVENFETTVRCKDGRVRIISWHSRNLTDEKGAPIGSIALGRDITERKQAEEALRTSEAQLSNAMKIAQLGYWEYDVANDLFMFNDHFYAIFRTSVEQVGGYTMSSARYAQLFVHPDDMPVVSIEIRKAIETTDPHYSRQLEHRIIFADGEIGYIAVRFFIVKDTQGRTVKTFGANQDITERKRLEEKLKERMGDLERLNQLFMGREHRMVELKREVNALCEQQGQRKRYDVPDQVDVLRKEEKSE